MLQVHPILSFDDPALGPYRTMKGQLGHQQAGVFVAEGEKVVRRLLESEIEIISVLLPEKWMANLRPILENRPERIDAYVAEKKVLESLTGFSMYQGVLGLAKVPAPAPLEALWDSAPAPRLFVAVDSLSNADNLGALIRNCAAFGVHGLVVGETCCHPYLRRSVRSSMGTIFKLPFVLARNAGSLTACLKVLRDSGAHLIAAHPHTDKKFLSSADFGKDACIVFGAEGSGISPEVLSICHEAVAIPMQNGVDSLNVATAAAAFLYEAARQRGQS